MMMKPAKTMTLLVALLLAACGGRTYWPDGGRDAGPDAPDLADSKVPDVADARVPDVADAKVTDIQKPDKAKPDLLPAGPDLLPGTWVTVKAGAFDMGSPKSEKCRAAGPSFLETLHKVTLSSGFMIMDAEVTQKDFEHVTQYNNSLSPKGAYPAHYVTWHEAAAYCDLLTKRINDLRKKHKVTPLLTHCYQNKHLGVTKCGNCPATATCGKQGKLGIRCLGLLEPPAALAKIYTCDGFRLPTEAEWEYAYRAGTQTPLYKAGKCDGAIKECNLKDGNAEKIGWYATNTVASDYPHLGKKWQPNAWKLYDMAGNVAEWTHDGYKDDLGAAAITDPVTLVVSEASTTMAIRGGSLLGTPANMRGAARAQLNHKSKVKDVGFRCVRTAK